MLLSSLQQALVSQRTWPSQDSTSPVAANQIAAGTFLTVKMATQESMSPVAANQIATSAFFHKNGHPRLDKPRQAAADST